MIEVQEHQRHSEGLSTLGCPKMIDSKTTTRNESQNSLVTSSNTDAQTSSLFSVLLNAQIR